MLAQLLCADLSGCIYSTFCCISSLEPIPFRWDLAQGGTWVTCTQCVGSLHPRIFHAGVFISKVWVASKNFSHLVTCHLVGTDSSLLQHNLHAFGNTQVICHLVGLATPPSIPHHHCLPSGFTFILLISKASYGMAAWQLLWSNIHTSLHPSLLGYLVAAIFSVSLITSPMSNILPWRLHTPIIGGHILNCWVGLLFMFKFLIG